MNFIVQYELCAFFFAIIIAIHFFSKYRFPSLQNKIFSVFLLIIVVYIGLDIVSALAIQYHQIMPIWLNTATNVLFFSFEIVLLPLLMLYILALSDQVVMCKKNIIWIIIGLVPVVIYELIIFLSPITHLVFYFDADGTYVRGQLFESIYILSLLYFIVSAVLINVFRKKLSKGQYYAFAGATVLILFAMILQYLFPKYLLIGMAMSLSVLMLYLTLQNPARMLDDMTGLFNRRSFLSIMKEKLRLRKKTNIIFVAIDHMGELNRTFGLECGDKVITELSDFFKKETSKALGFRIHGDQFVLVSKDRNICKSNIYKIINRFKKPFVVNGVRIAVSACICYAIDTEYNLTDETQIIAMLEYIMSIAKKSGQSTIMEIDKDMINERQHHEEIEITLRRAVEHDEIEVYLQPIFSIKEQKIVGAEALARLYDNNLGRISPELFIPLAEKSEIIVKLGEQVQRKVCKFIRDNGLYNNKYLQYIEINLSAVELTQKSLSTQILNNLQKYCIPASFLVFEITESVATSGYDAIEQTMNLLLEKGVHFALDDFGTGYSNLSSIMKLPFSTIKIDREMMLDAIKTQDNNILLHNLINMMKELKKSVIVEGVEEKEQLEKIVQMGADCIQGYIYGKPVPMSQFLETIKNN